MSPPFLIIYKQYLTFLIKLLKVIINQSIFTWKLGKEVLVGLGHRTVKSNLIPNNISYKYLSIISYKYISIYYLVDWILFWLETIACQANSCCRIYISIFLSIYLLPGWLDPVLAGDNCLPGKQLLQDVIPEKFKTLFNYVTLFSFF